MSEYRFPRDDGNEFDYQVAARETHERQRGRVVPMQPAEPAPLLVDIRVNGVVFGTLDPMQLKARAQIDLERVRGALDLLRWCNRHAGVNDQRGPNGEPSELDRLEEELAEMSLHAIIELAQNIGTALGKAVRVPKVNGRR